MIGHSFLSAAKTFKPRFVCSNIPKIGNAGNVYQLGDLLEADLRLAPRDDRGHALTRTSQPQCRQPAFEPVLRPVHLFQSLSLCQITPRQGALTEVTNIDILHKMSQ